MKVGDTVKWAKPLDADAAAARFVLVEHDGNQGVIRGGDSGGPARTVPMAELALADNAPFVVDPADD
ncbi:MAG: hypothetical protein JWO31_639 [Phycisphaerales bacterium]|nr:hypothetical protein [Phycisphaerales bacterium]